jgi:glycosyltransferase involved in cell wall biosynthesis
MNINDNSENIFKWVFRRKDELSSIVFIFVSKVNANNARFLPLFQNTQKVRLVYFPGLPIKYSDKILLKIFSNLQSVFSSKIGRYQKIHFFNSTMNFQNQFQILHVDDPTYSYDYINKIKIWEENCSSKGYFSKIVTTNTYTADWLKKNTGSSEIIIIEQGFHDIGLTIHKEIQNDFICGYSSPYINYGKDKDSNHATYGAEILIDKIIPELFSQDPSIKIYLIGRLGRNAKKVLEKYPNVTTFGRVNFSENMNILRKCTIGIYPRKIDNKRSMLKIFTYIGAGLPIVTFDLVDTEIVKQNALGFSVKESTQFVEKIVELKQNTETLKYFQTNIRLNREVYSWTNLAQKMESLL